jgi:glycosyltransferase involved in cell wall biosynthesis
MNHFLNKLGHDSSIIYISQLDKLEDIDSIDVFCPEFFITHKKVADFINEKLNPKTKLLLYFQCFIPNPFITALKHKNIYIVGVSDFVKLYYEPFGLPYKTIHNALNPDIFTDNKLDFSKKKGNFVFMASFQRGGVTAINVFNSLNIPNKKLHICSYYTPDQQYFQQIKQDDIIFHNSLSKVELKKLLDNCDYFVYGLNHPDNPQIHHDTFGNCILEAMACGVTVVTWSVACMPFVYGDLIETIEPIPYNNYDKLKPHSLNPVLGSPIGVYKILEKIQEIESNQIRKINQKIRARDWALEQLWSTRTNDLINFLK